MLPSTGYFKGINCPFYDSGLCERPYCHFRHVKKDSSTNAQGDGIESGAILQKLVSAAVQKVLQHTETCATTTSIQQPVVEENNDLSKVNNQSKATYNPTPIAELKKINSTETEKTEDELNEQRKKHIPVPYTPRKPATLPVKRSMESNSSPKPFVFITPSLKYKPGCTESVTLDLYTPKGSVESSEKYLPGVEAELQEYAPKLESQASSMHNYIPSDKSNSKKKLLEYKPTKVSVNTDKRTVTYQPTPKSLVPCFSSDEDEPDPKKVKLSSDLNSLDDLGPEFDILDQILDEEKLNIGSYTEDEELENNKTNENKDELLTSRTHKEDSKSHENIKIIEDNDKKHKESSKSQMNVSKQFLEDSKTHKDSKLCKEKQLKTDSKTYKEDNKKHKKSSHKQDHEKSTQKTDSKKNQDKAKTENKDKYSVSKECDGKLKESNKKSHKSSSKEQLKNEKKEKTNDKEKHSSSKSSYQSSRHSKHSSSKSYDRHSKHSNSSSSKHSSESKEKSDHSSKSKRSSKEKHKHKERPSNDSIQVNDNDANEDIFFYNNDEKLLEMSESDEETIELECKRIFEEYVPTEKSNTNSDNVNNLLDINQDNETEYIPAKKRISRTIDKNIKVMPREPIKKDFKVSAAQAMAERLAKVKEFHSSRLGNTSTSEMAVPKLEPPKFQHNPSTHPGNSKIRIAHVPYASTMMNAKKTIAPVSRIKIQEPTTSSTIVQTVKKGVQRVAHVPNEKFIDRPGVLEPLASKIPANIRSTYLNMMIDECLKIYLSPTDAYARAQHEELITSKKCTAVQIYKNSAVLTVSRLRKEFQECNGIKKAGSDCSKLQNIPQTISFKSVNIGSWSIESKKIVDNSQEFTGAKFYKNIQKWILTEEQLQENGFPRPHKSGAKGKAIIYGQNKQTPPKGLIRKCCRCKRDYIVDKKGFPAITEECIYHPNNKYRVRGEAKYQCCSQDSSSDGCCIAPCHVYEYVDFDNLKGFIKTMPPDFEMDDYGVYSLDCEMCYTTHGLDLTRVTVINSTCKVVYETLIKPLHPIIDYNTRYSGITEEQMANVTTTLIEVQATLLSMFSSKTILVGHSLESDFKALKLIHDTVIDTSVLFPHKMGPPYKRALRNLSSEYLKKIIQNSVDGHDSAEDATVCMELLIYKLKEDLKTR